ncbi:MAG: hypothetical protein V3S83_12575 [Gemmatimonadota bacterium]
MPQHTGQAQLSRQLQRGDPGFTDFDALLGGGRLFGGGNFAPGGGRTAGDIAGQRRPEGLTEGQQRTLDQFLSPSLQGEQQATLERLARRASGQGLIGGAVQGQIQDLAGGFLASNRAQAFGQVSNIVGSRLGQLEGQVQPFLQQALGLSDQFQGGINAQSLRSILGASGQTAEQFEDFAQPALDALNAFGLGGDAIAGVAQRQGATLQPGGQSGAAGIGDAFVDFLNPEIGGSRISIAQQLGIPVSNRPRGFGRRAGVGFRNISRAGSRAGAAEFLAGEVGSRLTRARGSAIELETLGGAAQAFTRGDPGAAQELVGADVSQFGELFQTLGLTQGQEQTGTARDRGGFVRGRFLPGGSNLFRTVFG